MTDPLNQAKEIFLQGLISLEKNDFKSAELLFTSALLLAPDRESILINLSTTQILLEKWNDVLVTCEKLLHKFPKSQEGLINHAIAYAHLNQPKKSLFLINKALSLNADSYEAWSNKGIFLLDLFRFDEAILCFKKALQINSKSIEALIGIGNVKNQYKKYSEALNYFNYALKIDINNPKANLNKGMSLIRLGDFREGWKLFEYRWQVTGTKEFKKFQNIPLWLGDKPLQNKTLIIWAEQGFGDTIQFSRYIPILLNENPGLKIIASVPNALINLFKGLHKDILVASEELEAITGEFQCPIMSLPYALKSTLQTIPNMTPYIYPEAFIIEKWRKKLQEISITPNNNLFNSIFRIGLCWEGSGKYATQLNPRRNVDPELIQKLVSEIAAKNLKIEFHSLQIMPAPPELKIFSHHNLLTDFNETAGLICNMDLVVSVDTSVAHLSGALNKRTFLMIPDPPDFLSPIEGDRNPWYPETLIFRQMQSNSWAEPISLIKEKILGLYKNYK